MGASGTTPTPGGGISAPLPPNGGVYPSQMPLYGLMVNSLAELRREYWGLGPGLAHAIAYVSVGVAAGVGLVATASWVMQRSSSRDWVIYAVCVLPLAVSVCTALRRSHDLFPDDWFPDISVEQPSPSHRRLRFHRFDVAMGQGFFAYMATWPLSACCSEFICR